MRGFRFHALLLATAAMLVAGPAHAQRIDITVPANTPDIGNVTAAISGTTVFRVSTSGSVTVISGTGSRQSAGAVSNTITIGCTGNNNGVKDPCNAQNVVVRVTPTATQTGRRADRLTNLQAAINSGAQIVRAPIWDGNSLTFTIGPIGHRGSKSFRLGLDLPILGGFSAAGRTTSGYLVEAGFAPDYSASGSGAAAATVRNPTQIDKGPDLRFGAILQNGASTGTITLDATTGVVSSSNPGGLVVNAHSAIPAGRALYSIASEAGQLINVTVPTSFTMTGPGGLITVSTTKTFSGGSVTMPGSPGTSSNQDIGIGGTFNVSGKLNSGSYTGTFSVVFSWN